MKNTKQRRQICWVISFDKSNTAVFGGFLISKLLPGLLIWIRLRVKSWIRIRIEVKIQER
jgi:hypothetical protein